MARDDREEAGGGQAERGGREYSYRKCATCHMKVHLSAYECPRCKNRVNWDANRKERVNDTIYSSHNPEDRIYETKLCSVERCMVCEEALLGNPCRHEYCYGTGRSDQCEACGRNEHRRYRCCQEAQREEAALEEAMRNDPEWWRKRRHDG